MLPATPTRVRNLLSHPRLLEMHALLEGSAGDQQTPTALSLLGAKKSLLSTCIPLSLVGGTAVLYKAVLDHPTSTSLTPLSLVYLLLLASQYACQPWLSKRFISKQVIKTSLTLTEEIIKSILAIVGLLCSSSSSTVLLEGWNLRESLRVAGIPAVLYSVQGILQYTAYLHLDSVTYNGLSQTKVFASAVACAVLLGQTPTLRQCMALLLLVVSTFVFQGSLTFRPTDVTPENTASPSSAVQPKNKKSAWWLRGVLPCLSATLLSGVAGALSQKGMQQQGLGGFSGRNAYLYTLEVSAYSAISAYVISTMRPNSDGGANSTQATPLETPSSTGNGKSLGAKSVSQKLPLLFRDWTLSTMLPVACKAFGGVLTALVHKHAGSVSKGFALTLGLCLAPVWVNKNWSWIM